jgi:hypothetical protein
VARANAGSTIVTQPVGSQTAPTVVQRALINIRKLFFTSKDLQDPERLYQVIHQHQQAVVSALNALGTCPLSVGVLIKGLVWAPGETKYLNHGLGRPFQGYICVGSHGPNVWAGVYDAQPVGTTTAQVIPLVQPTAGTFDLWIF